MAGIVELDPAERVSQFAGLERKFAERGFHLHPLTDDSLIVARWGMTRVLPNLDAAAQFLKQIGGRDE